jgi:hypothetical protein
MDTDKRQINSQAGRHARTHTETDAKKRSRQRLLVLAQGGACHLHRLTCGLTRSCVLAPVLLTYKIAGRTCG